MSKLKPVSKAIAGAAAGAVIAFVAVYPDGITGPEWGKVAGAAIVAAFTVYFAPKNKVAAE